jgi:hypothetical protein
MAMSQPAGSMRFQMGIVRKAHSQKTRAIVRHLIVRNVRTMLLPSGG